MKRSKSRFPNLSTAQWVRMLALVPAIAGCLLTASPVWGELHNISPPDRNVRLVFIHHSTGEAWLNDDHGELGIALRNNRYYVSDTNYGWGLDGIGSRTDIGHWWLWFRGPDSAAILNALYTTSAQWSSYSRLPAAPLGPNEIILFKSCFPNSGLKGKVSDPIPSIDANPLKEQDAYSAFHTISNAKGIYIDLLNYFKTRRDRLFIVIAAPPLSDPTWSANARAFNNWLVNDWLKGYPYKNVFVFDFYNVLTTNGGSPDVNDLGQTAGNHHRWWNGAVQHKTDGDDADGNANISEYPSGDDHPTRAGDLKATDEFVKLLNIAYHRWRPLLREALDNTGLVFTTGGNARWLGETAVSCYNGDAAQSGRLAASQSSWFSTSVTGPGTLKFYWKVSTVPTFGILRFAVDGATKAQINVEGGWVQKTYSIGPGAHTLTWTFRKLKNGSGKADTGWVDRVQWSGS